MDEQTFFRVREADERIRRTAMLIEQQRLHVLHLHPSRRAADMGQLKSLMDAYTRLLNYRHALIAEPPCALIN